MECWEKKFVRLRFHYSSKMIDVTKAMAIKDNHIPEKLFKYRTFSQKHWKALEDNVLWLSSPQHLNDPNEANMYFDIKNIFITKSLARKLENGTQITDEDRFADIFANGELIDSDKFTNRLIDKAKGVPRNLKKSLMFAKEKVMSEFNQILLRKMINRSRSGYSILSLSRTSVSDLMWSHYSASHTGFCIEYNFGKLIFDDLRRRLCYPVFYSRKPRDITKFIAKPFRDFNIDFAVYTCLVKKIPWEYEQEWRIVMALGPGCADFAMPMPQPSAIILGSATKKEDEDRMRLLCLQRSIPLKKIVLEPGSFRAHVSDLS